MPINVTATLKKALQTLESEGARIAYQITAIRQVLNGTGATTTPATRRRRMSAAARRAVSQRMKAYWAKHRTATQKPRQATRSTRKSTGKAK